jgi:hypothetical protein
VLFNHHVLTITKKARDTGKLVVSHIDDPSLWLFSVGEGHKALEIWSKSVQGFSRYVQTM